MLIGDLIEGAKEQLAHLEDPALEARYLMADALGCSPGEVFLQKKDPFTGDVGRFWRAVHARADRVPYALIVGEKAFYHRLFWVQPGVLVPRDDTERLAEEALRRLPEDRPLQLLEIGVGSGVIAITLLAERPLAEVWAVDIADNCLALAKKNAERHGVDSRLHLMRSDLFEACGDMRFDAIVSNPPYIDPALGGTLAPEVIDHDPPVALFSPSGGLALIRRIVEQAPRHLRRGGLLALEIGWDQGTAVGEIMEAAQFAVEEPICDYGGHDRVMIGQFASKER